MASVPLLEAERKVVDDMRRYERKKVTIALKSHEKQLPQVDFISGLQRYMLFTKTEGRVNRKWIEDNEEIPNALKGSLFHDCFKACLALRWWNRWPEIKF